MRIRWLAGVIVLSAVVFSGCASSRVYKSYSEEMDSWTFWQNFGYTWQDWGCDLWDCLSVDVGAGECIGLDIQPTKVLQTGFLFGDVMKFGWRNRGIGFYREVMEEGGFGWAYYRSRRFEPIMGDTSLFNRARLFEGFPLRDNAEGHWADVGGEVGLVFFDAGAHVSLKHILAVCVDTVMLPFNLFIRQPLTRRGCRVPEIDLCDDGVASQVRKKYQLELIKNPQGFVPTEELNEMWEVPY